MCKVIAVRRTTISVMLLGASMASLATAADTGDKVTELLGQGYKAFSVTPVFRQLVAFGHPNEFRPAFENATPTFYIQESVLKGESVENWTQMITLTGTKGGTAEQPNWAVAFIQGTAGGFQRSCPDTFVAKALGKVNVGGYEGFIALMGCGAVKSGAPRSEVAFVISVKGASDLYTIQWAERGAPLQQAPVLDEPKWKSRFQQLLPIRICDPVPNEAAPYPSCINRQ
jgi:hypothetical protein